MQEDSEAKFGKWRSLFWPIHAWELKKFVPMFFMFFLISFNYNALRACKDSLVVTAPQSGAEAIPFIKVWAILPGALLLTYLFTRLSNSFNREKVFYIMMSLFLGFFLIFTFALFPAQDFIHPHALADKLQAALPKGFSGLIAMFRNWTLTLFYVMSELWGTAILSVLWWGFANEVTRVGEAKRYYGLLMIGANLAGILSGQVSVYLCNQAFIESIPFGKTNWDQSILFLNSLIIFSGVATIAIYRWLNHHVIRPSERHAPPPEKIKMSLRNTFAYLAKSKYLLCMALIVLTYNISINLIEVVWKNQIKQLHPHPSDYNIYMGEVMTLMGIIATVASLVTAFVIRKFSWTMNALIPAGIMLVTGLGFFLVVLFPDSGLTGVAAMMGSTPLALSVALGGLQNSLGRASKYTIFDATKEIAFIPLSKESKQKGKAAIDGVGSRIGKSGGSVIHQSLILIFSSVAACTPYVATIFFVVILVWIYSVVTLGKQFDSLTKPALTKETA
ncbi:MAG: NTP/NDP exchange transporter [Verrucomicrobia bacterium]|nr:NTP/NDP exchange transporter [Verrucomicrobiota bacterium]MBU6445905.1 NTP/NDP exchange transporter [Verrucomicrobiota bacterium]MDE3047563.1 NTP/NDP exchange transporter [Verrucomicrobiota bacterium]